MPYSLEQQLWWLEPRVFEELCAQLIKKEHDAALLSEAALAEDWNRAEEDAAWAYLQPGKSS